jgi:hypothetical protein
MANLKIPPIPQDAIGENFRWRDWFTKLSVYVENSQGTGSTVTQVANPIVGGSGITVSNLSGVTVISANPSTAPTANMSWEQTNW